MLLSDRVEHSNHCFAVKCFVSCYETCQLAHAIHQATPHKTKNDRKSTKQLQTLTERRTHSNVKQEFLYVTKILSSLVHQIFMLSSHLGNSHECAIARLVHPERVNCQRI